MRLSGVVTSRGRGLLVTPEQRERMRALGATEIVGIRPLDFLHLTTPAGYRNPEYAKRHDIEDWDRSLFSLHPQGDLDGYNQLIRARELPFTPFLVIHLDDEHVRKGTVTGHDGRHRAVALMRDAPDALLPVAIFLTREPVSASLLLRPDEFSAARTARAWAALVQGGIDAIPRLLQPQQFDTSVFINRTKSVSIVGVNDA